MIGFPSLDRNQGMRWNGSAYWLDPNPETLSSAKPKMQSVCRANLQSPPSTRTPRQIAHPFGRIPKTWNLESQCSFAIMIVQHSSGAFGALDCPS